MNSIGTHFLKETKLLAIVYPAAVLLAMASAIVSENTSLKIVASERSSVPAPPPSVPDPLVSPPQQTIYELGKPEAKDSDPLLDTTPRSSPAVSSNDIKQRQRELEVARIEQNNAEVTRQKIKTLLAAIGENRAKLNRQLIDIAAQVRSVETNLTDTEGRLSVLDAHVRVASTDPGELIVLRKSIAAEHDYLITEREKLKIDQAQLEALVEQRRRNLAEVQKNLEVEGARAIELAKQVDSLHDLISKMERDVKTSATAAATANQQGTPASGNPVQLENPNRTKPALAFESAKGLLAFPVNGTKIRDFGSSDSAGGVEKGISLAARSGAQVTTPCDGWVVYAGPFRSYGQLLILNTGGGYHVLIAGMERISVNIGQFVLTGEPVATMGTTSQVASILAPNVSQPVLYVEFRKDGTPIDPSPWWTPS
jgi:murein hydrolase activator